MSHLSAVAGCGFVVVLTACAVTREGTLTRLSSGDLIPVTVRVEEESVTIVGTNPATGEKLEGTLHVQRGDRGGKGMLGPRPPGGRPEMSPGMLPPPATGQRATLEMTGMLEGDKGTSLKCALQVEKRLRLRGTGICRPVEGDELNPTYRLRF